MFRKGYFVICIMMLLLLPSLAGTDSFLISHSDDKDGSDSWMPSRGDTTIYGGLYLNSDQALEDEASLRGWSGNGSDSDPFLIENTTFNGIGGSYCFILRSTTLHVVFRNCTFHNATSISSFQQHAGLSLWGVRGVLVENCTSYDNYQGIFIMGDGNIVRNCTVFDNQGFGVSISDPNMNYRDGNQLLNSSISDNGYAGIWCSAVNNRILGNRIENNTISFSYWSSFSNHNEKSNNYIGYNTIYDGSIQTSGRNDTIVNNSITTSGIAIGLLTNIYNTHYYKVEANVYSNNLSGCFILLDPTRYNMKYLVNISENNTIDGKPVYFRNGEDLSGKAIPSNGGEVIIFNCINGSVSDLETGSAGILAYGSTGFKIVNCTFDRQSFGVQLYSCNENMIQNNTFHRNRISIDEIEIETYPFSPYPGEVSGFTLMIDGPDNHVYGNSFFNSSIFLSNLNRRQFIDETNTVNGKKVIYHYEKDLDGTVLNGECGQIILSKVSNIVIENLTFSHLPQPIRLYRSDDLHIRNCSFNNISRSAIFVDLLGQNLSITDSQFSDCIYGIEMFNSRVNLIEKCVFRRCLGGTIINPYGCMITNCVFIQNTAGIRYDRYLDKFGQNTIVENIFLDTGSFAIHLNYYSTFNYIYNNTFINNNWNWEELGNGRAQIYVDGGNNWLYDYPSQTGNYWSDHFTNDMNEDDRYDEPYEINYGKMDPYPLTYSPHLPTLNLSGFGTNMAILFNWSWNGEVKWPMVARQIFLYRNASDNFSPVTSFRSDTAGGKDNNPGSLDEMGYFVRVHATTVTGGYNIPGPRSNIISCSMDVTKPHLRIISPVEDLVQYENEVLFQWEGWDNESGLTRFEISLDGGEWGDVGLSKSRSYTNLSDGHHSFSVGCWDLANNYIAISSHVTIDRSGPEIDIFSPRDGTHIGERSVTLKCRIIDRDSSISLINIYLDGEFYRGMPHWTEVVIGALSEGEHYVTVQAFDELGNVNSETNHFTVDLTKPDILIVSPYEGEIVLEDSVEITWNVSERDRPNRGYSIRLDGGMWHSVADVETFTFGLLTEGHHTVEVSVKDLAGNSNYCVVNFWVQLTPITLDVQKPLEGSVLDNDTVQVSWLTQITTSTTYYLVKLDEGGWIEVWNTYHLLSNLSDGGHYISIVMTDGVRNYANGIVNFAIDTSPPILTGIYPTGDEVEVTSEIWVTFDEPIDLESLDIYILSVPGEIERSGERYFHVRSLDLRYATTYQVALRCSDLLGNEMMPIMWTFKTVDRCWIRGEVLGQDGSAISGVEIYLDGKLTGKTNKDGSYELITASGEHEVAFKYNDWAYGLTLDRIDPGGTFNVPTIVIGGEQEGEKELNVHLIIIMNLVALSILFVLVFILFSRVRSYRELMGAYEE